jgi:hypothetical protein
MDLRTASKRLPHFRPRFTPCLGRLEGEVPEPWPVARRTRLGSCFYIRHQEVVAVQPRSPRGLMEPASSARQAGRPDGLTPSQPGVPPLRAMGLRRARSQAWPKTRTSGPAVVSEPQAPLTRQASLVLQVSRHSDDPQTSRLPPSFFALRRPARPCGEPRKAQICRSLQAFWPEAIGVSRSML